MTHFTMPGRFVDITRADVTIQAVVDVDVASYLCHTIKYLLFGSFLYPIITLSLGSIHDARIVTMSCAITVTIYDTRMAICFDVLL